MSAYNQEVLKTQSIYGSLNELIKDCADVLLPPERMTVSEAAEKYRVVDNSPIYVGPWDNNLASYLKEPQEMLESKEHSAVCLVAPAQSMKTEIALNWLAYNVMCDPSDYMIVEKNETEASNFSKMKVDKMLRRSLEVKKKLVNRRTANNVFNKQFVSGTYLLLTSPTENSLSGKTLRRVALTDYDRMPENVGGEGSAFDLARRRTNTFKRLGMTYVESSPSRDCEDPGYRRPDGSHEGPPVNGIIEIYNRGDRRLLHWHCPHCQEWFEPDFDVLRWPDTDDMMEAAESCYMACPHCFDSNGAIITQSMRPELNESAIWLPQGQTLDKDGNRHGKALRSDIASFWLKGPATGLGQWKTLVINYLKAKETYEQTQDDRPLKTTVNTDQGKVYIPPNVSELRSPEDLMGRAKDLGDRVVPVGCRVLAATVDVQKRYFSVQVSGVIPVKQEETGQWTVDFVVIDRFDIRKAGRTDSDGDPMAIEPAAYQEDWDLLISEVIEKTYSLDGDPDKSMRVKAIMADSGGAKGTTEMAYKFWRRARDLGLADRFVLMKGEPNKKAPMVTKHHPDAGKKSKAGARGEIPVWFLNSNQLKDWLDNCLSRSKPGGNYFYFPDWLTLSFYKELCAETRNAKGVWENLNRRRNESVDHCYMLLGITRILGLQRIDWETPPLWAEEWSKNNMIVSSNSDFVIDEPKKVLSMEELGKLLG